MHAVVAALLVFVAAASAQTFFGNSAYLYNAGPFTQSQANAFCVANGYQLASIHSAEENDFVFAFNPSNAALKWIGGLRDASIPTLSVDSFKWSDGSAWDYNAFNQVPNFVEPNNKVAPENCVQTGHKTATYTNGAWNDAPCSNRNAAVCKRPKATCTANIVTIAEATVTYNGYVETDTASLACVAGYVQTGTASFTCGANGQWVAASGNSGFSCAPVACPTAPTLPTYGWTATTSGVFGDSASLTCQTGYTGSQSVLCQADGTWETTTYTCDPVPCPNAPSVPTNGWTSTTSGVFGDSASLECDNGYTGSQSVLCQADGTWEATTYTCAPVDCGAFPTPTAPKAISCTGTVFQDTCTAACTSGNFYGTTTYTCQADGTWTTGCFGCSADPIYGTNQYRYFATKRTQPKAKAACIALGMGWNLASVHSAQENSFLYSLNPDVKVLRWIGGEKNLAVPLSKTSFTWSDGSAWDFEAFNDATSEPNNKVKPENCVLQGHSIAAFANGAWNDARCSLSNHYICKKALPTC